MHRSSYAALLGLVSLFTLGSAACGQSPCSYSSPSSAAGAPTAGNDSAGAKSAGAATPSSAAAAGRAIAEADIVQLDHEQNRIYAMSKGGTLAVVDASKPAALSLLGKTALVGQPFEMYRRGSILLVMSNGAVGSDGNLHVVLSEDQVPSGPPADADGAVIAAIDVSDPAAMKTLATFKVPGEIADSRIVGNVLYLATYQTATCWSCGSQPRTLVTSFDVTNGAAPKQVDQATFDTDPGASGFNAAWSTPWKRSIVATTSRMYVGGLASNGQTTTEEGIIEVLDISDPSGKLRHGATISMAGPVMSRWQMDEYNGTFRVISQRGAGQTSNGSAFPDVDTFRIESSDSIVRVGHTTLKLPMQEGLKTVSFDGPRAYAITFNQTDPLFTIDLTDPAAPTQKGQLSMPGWVFHLEPKGDKLLGLGLDRNDTTGNLNVSLFDVADLNAPKLVNRVSFGPTNMYEDYMITSGVLAEDQDRIQKAFRIFSDGMIAVPFSAGNGGCTASAAAGSPDTLSITAAGGGVELLDWTPTSLTKRGFLPMAGNPRRAVRRDSDLMKEVIAISDSNVSSFAVSTASAPNTASSSPNADVVIGTCVARSASYPGGMPMGGDVAMGRPGVDGTVEGHLYDGFPTCK